MLWFLRLGFLRDHPSYSHSDALHLHLQSSISILRLYVSFVVPLGHVGAEAVGLALPQLLSYLFSLQVPSLLLIAAGREFLQVPRDASESLLRLHFVP